VGLVVFISVGVMLSSAAAAVATKGYVSPWRGARAAANSHCRSSDFAMQCIRIGRDSAGAGVGNPGVQPTRAGPTHASGAHAYGIDFAWRRVKARAARKMGARFAASYLSTAASKNWTRAMIHAYHAAGLATVCVWETSATRALARYAAGRTDARAALTQEQALGVQPRSRSTLPSTSTRAPTRPVQWRPTFAASTPCSESSAPAATAATGRSGGCSRPA
jgi:hypothetical protein